MAATPDSPTRPISGLMYHYTSIDALASIIEHKTLRATSVHYLNDASESELGLSLISQIVKLMQAVSDNDRRFLDYLIWWLEHRFAVSSGAVYVLCFSEVANQLSQWRGYTPHGRGVCIGIDIGLLVNRMQQMAKGWTFHRCYYDSASQRAYLEAIVTRMLGEASAAPTTSNEERMQHYANVVGQNTSDLLQIAAMIKDKAFADEREVRFISPLILNRDSRVKFRTGKTTVIPYVDFQLVRDLNESLREAVFWIGPSPHQPMLHNAVALLAERFNFSQGTGFQRSAIPYREL